VDNGWEKRKYQAYREGRQEAGYELWADLWNHEKLQQRKREIGSWAFASEYMNNPVSDETAPIKEHMIRYWTSLPAQFNTVIAVDPAYSEDEKSDYKVAALIACDVHNNRYLINYIRTHCPTGEFIDSILNLFIQNKPTITALGIPAGGTEKEFYQSVVKKATERRLYPPFVELKNVFNTATGESKRNKKSRIIASLQPLFEAGKYFISPSHIEARDELLTIGSSRWDDLTDAMSYAEQLIQPIYFEPETKPKSVWEELHRKKTVVDYGY
jgi:hypothetical protein